MVVGCTRLATDVDHALPIAQYPALRLEWFNLRALCHQHHSRRTALDQSFARPRINAQHGANIGGWGRTLYAIRPETALGSLRDVAAIFQ